MVKFSSFKLSS